jgi:hypothetical protein
MYLKQAGICTGVSTHNVNLYHKNHDGNTNHQRHAMRPNQPP